VSKVLWHTMVSVDGFIAGRHDDMRAFFEVDGGSGETVREVLQSIGALLVGRRTQDVEDRDQPGFYGGAYRGPFFVLRHDPPPEPPVVKGVTGRFLNLPIDEAVGVAREAASGADVVVLGADVARQCLEAGLLRQRHPARRSDPRRRRRAPLRPPRRQPRQAPADLVHGRG
jgi:dihydrofolate reductase